jgi:hypothetical protein
MVDKPNTLRSWKGFRLREIYGKGYCYIYKPNKDEKPSKQGAVASLNRPQLPKQSDAFSSI